MKFIQIIFFLVGGLVFSQKLEGRLKLIAIDSTANFYILKFSSKKIIDSSTCFLVTSGKMDINPKKRLKINRHYFMRIEKPYKYYLSGVENLSGWGVDDKTIWNKGDKCKVYVSKNIDGLNYTK